MHKYIIHLGTDSRYKQLSITGRDKAIQRYNDIAINHPDEVMMLCNNKDKIIKERNARHGKI